MDLRARRNLARPQLAAHRDGSRPLTSPRGSAVAWTDLPGWPNDDLRDALACLRRSLSAPALRPAIPASRALRAALDAARRFGAEANPAAARRFFEAAFSPFRLSETEAFYTGYYEPVVDGSTSRSDAFRAPLLARPDDLVTLGAGDPRPAWAEGLTALRRGPDGTLAPYPDRAAIEADLGAYEPVAWVRDPTEAFTVQVQGSARVRLPDGGRLRLTYAGRNGQPYTSLGRALAATGAVPAAELTMDRLCAWVREHGQEPGQPGHALLMRNRSYVFFRAEPDPAPGSGPTGGAGVPLVAGRSVAVDRALWSYGLPFWVDVPLPGEAEPFRRLCVADDTGSAIVGAARVDLFMGSGREAGRRAGAIRHRGGLTVLWPRDALG